MRRQAQQRGRPAQSPPGIVKTLIVKFGIMRPVASASFDLQQFFQIADGRRLREPGFELCFAQVDLIAVFEGAEEFDSVERA
jgi:hypothetical protein